MFSIFTDEEIDVPISLLSDVFEQLLALNSIKKVSSEYVRIFIFSRARSSGGFEHECGVLFQFN
jgi:hypothetical protein